MSISNQIYFRYPSSFDLKDKRVFFALLTHQSFCSYIYGDLYITLTIFLISCLEFHNFQIKLLGCRLEAFGQLDGGNQEADYAKLVGLIKVHIEIKRLVIFFANIPNLCIWTDNFLGALTNSTSPMADLFSFKFYSLWAYWLYL